VGELVFSDNAGGTFASVKGSVDAAPSGTSDFPGRLSFFTTADGASSQTERMRIDSSGRMGLGTTSPEEILHIAAASEAVNTRDGVMLQSTSALAADTGLPIVFTSHIGNFANYGVASIAGRKENATSGDAAGYLQFATGSSGGAITEKMRISSTGSLTVSTSSGLGFNGSAANMGIHQVTGGKTTMSSSAGWKKLFHSGHTFVGTIKLYVTSGDQVSGGGVAKEYRVFVLYGAPSVTQVGTHSYGGTAGYLSNIELRYLNSGYQIQARVTWSSGSTPVVNWSAEGLASSSWSL